MAIASDGMQFGWPSPAVPRLIEENTIISDKQDADWITNWYIVGNICGVLLSVTVFNKLSRKLSLWMSCIPIIAGWCGILLPKSRIVLYTSRFIAGIGRNMIYVTVPMYIGEIADPKIRGILGSLIYMTMNVGVILVYGITPYFSYYASPAVGLLLSLMGLILLWYVPESPYYLLSKSKRTEALKSLKRLRNADDVEEEFKQLVDAVNRQTAEEKSFIGLFTSKSNRKALGILLFLRTAQMMSGVSVITMNVHMIFKQAGGTFSPEISALIYGVMMFISCFCTAGFVDKYGRKPMMVLSCAVTALILTSQGIYFYCKVSRGFNTDLISWLPILLVTGFVFSYRFGLGTVPMVMVGELFPANVKVAGVVLSDLMYSVSSLTSNILFQYVNSKLGICAPFWIFGIFCFITAVFSLLFVPETNNKTLEEIQFLLMNKPIFIKQRNESDVGNNLV